LCRIVAHRAHTNPRLACCRLRFYFPITGFIDFTIAGTEGIVKPPVAIKKRIKSGKKSFPVSGVKTTRFIPLYFSNGRARIPNRFFTAGLQIVDFQ
jgi:hypothetical protein